MLPVCDLMCRVPSTPVVCMGADELRSVERPGTRRLENFAALSVSDVCVRETVMQTNSSAHSRHHIEGRMHDRVTIVLTRCFGLAGLTEGMLHTTRVVMCTMVMSSAPARGPCMGRRSSR